MTSSVWRPIEPVAPRMATLTGRVISVEQMEGRHVEVDEDRWKKYRIEPIQDASMAGDEVRGILDLRDSLHLRFDQIAHQRTEPDKDPDDYGVQRREREDPRHSNQHDDHRCDHAGDRALKGLARADRCEEGATGESTTHEQRSGCPRGRREDDEQGPHAPP